MKTNAVRLLDTGAGIGRLRLFGRDQEVFVGAAKVGICRSQLVVGFSERVLAFL